MDKLKKCPLLPGYSVQVSLTVPGEEYRVPYFADCQRDKCAAYIDGRCGHFGTMVTVETRCDDGK